VFFNSVKNK